MTRLVIDATNGIAFRAKAWLESNDGTQRISSEGSAVLNCRAGFSPVEAGNYGFVQTQAFPKTSAVRDEFGAQGLVFKQSRNSAPVLVHGGALTEHHSGSLKPVSGSIRLSTDLLAAVLLAARKGSLTLVVRVGAKSSAWKFWAQPAQQDVVADDDGVDFFDWICPELAPFRHPNSAMAWFLYFEHQEEVEQERAQSQSQAQLQADADAYTQTQPYAPDNSNAGYPDDGSSALFQVNAMDGVDSQGRILAGNVDDSPACRIDNSDTRGTHRADPSYDSLPACDVTQAVSVDTSTSY